MLVSSETLTQLVTTMCERGGSGGEEARRVAENLVTASLMGHDSHGVGLIPRYVKHVLNGTLHPNEHAHVVADRGAFLLIDGHMGYGQVIGAEAMKLGIAKAREGGVAVVGLRNSHHLGRIGAWAEICAEAGFISIHYVNAIGHVPLVAPHGGIDARYTTNPYCTAFPGTAGGPPIVLDMATSKVAQGKVRVAYNKGVPVPDECLIDCDGNPTNDPGVMFVEPKGAMLSFAQHKGYGLALVCELLSGALTGGGTSRPEQFAADTIRNNMLSIVIDPKGFGEDIPFAGEIDQFVAWVKDSRPAPGVDQVMVPGDPERKTMAERRRDGIPIDERTWAEMVEAGLSVGMNRLAFEGAAPA